MVEGGRLNVVDGRILWRTVRPKAQGGQPRMTIHEVAVEYGLNWPLKGKNTPYLYKILYLIFDYPHKHYTFKHFEI